MYEVAHFESDVQPVSRASAVEMLGSSMGMVYGGVLKVGNAQVAVPDDVQQTGLWLVNELAEARLRSLDAIGD